MTYTEGDTVRPVLYRASLAEMTVPYGDPSPTQARKNAFDVREYGLGMLANSLILGCDCVGEIHYLDGHFVDAAGNVITIPQAICIHEEDVATVGNHEYGLYWYLYQDGRIELDIKLTGILSTAALANGSPSKYGTSLGDGLYGPNHQHFFCMRLDTQVDGVNTSVVEVNTRPAPTEENPFGNASTARSRS